MSAGCHRLRAALQKKIKDWGQLQNITLHRGGYWKWMDIKEIHMTCEPWLGLVGHGLRSKPLRAMCGHEIVLFQTPTMVTTPRIRQRADSWDCTVNGSGMDLPNHLHCIIKTWSLTIPMCSGQRNCGCWRVNKTSTNVAALMVDVKTTNPTPTIPWSVA